MRTAAELGELATLACVLEAAAPKPGNVFPGRPFDDADFADFAASAAALGAAIAQHLTVPLGELILRCVEATRRRVPSNTNLGIALLLAPLAKAAMAGGDLRPALAAVLAGTTQADARAAYEAIRLARPGGLGSAPAEDVTAEPSVTLREAMALAAHRDTIAREWTTDFMATWEVGVPVLRAGLRDGLGWDGAAVESFLALLAAYPDTLIVRKIGMEEAARVSRRAAEVRAAGGMRTGPGWKGAALLDQSLRDPGHRLNPGTTADLVAAALYVVLLEDGYVPSGAERVS